MENELALSLSIGGHGRVNRPVDEACTSAGPDGEVGATLRLRPQSQGTRPKPQRMRQSHAGPVLHVGDAMPPPPAKRRFISRLKVIWVNQHAPKRCIDQIQQWGRTRLANGMQWLEESIHTPVEASTTEILESFFGEGRSHGK